MVVPNGYMTSAEICVLWPILIVEGLALSAIIAARAPEETVICIVFATEPETAVIVAVPVACLAVTRPVDEMVATLVGVIDHATVAPLGLPVDARGVAVACTACPFTSDESRMERAIERVELSAPRSIELVESGENEGLWTRVGCAGSQETRTRACAPTRSGVRAERNVLRE